MNQGSTSRTLSFLAFDFGLKRTGVATGKLKYRETVAEGIEAAPEAFIGLLKGRNFGKQLVKLI